MWISLATIVLALIALKALVVWLEPRMAFYPIRGVQETPGAMSLSYVDLRIPTRDGETLHAWWLEHPQPRGEVIFWHGNGGNLSLWLDVIAGLRTRGFSVLAADYRGYGASTGTPAEQGLYRDADATIEEFMRRRGHREVPLLYWGRSLGCPVAAYAATMRAPDALVLESPMPDVRSLLRTNSIMWLLSLLSSYRFPTSLFLRNYDGPLLVVHGDRDTIVPFSAGRHVFDEARTRRKTFAAVAGGDHNDLHVVNPAEYWRAIDDFVGTLNVPRR
jgi:uncharacterized protein